MGPQHAADAAAVKAEIASLDAAAALLRAHPDEEIEFWSPANAAQIQGILWFVTLRRELKNSFPGRHFDFVLECGSRGDLAIEALRHAFSGVHLTASGDVRRKVEDIATASGARVWTERPIFP